MAKIRLAHQDLLNKLLCHLPKPYPDELLYSVVARYIARTGARPGSVAMALRDMRALPKLEFPTALKKVADRTCPIWGMDFRQILMNLTLFPFYTHYASAELSADSAQELALGSNSDMGWKFKTYVDVRFPSRLQFCPECREQDLQNYGETFWHRIHNLAGVTACPDHQIFLIKTHAENNFSGNTPRHSDATLATADIAQGMRAGLAVPPASYVSLARRCRDILVDNTDRWLCDDLLRTYREALEKKGYAPCRDIYKNILTRNLICFFSAPSTDSLFTPNFRNYRNRLSVLLSGGERNSFNTAMHAMIQIFIEEAPDTSPVREDDPHRYCL